MTLRGALLAAVAGLCLSGCATAPPPAADTWSGRLALQVQDQPDESFSASFELRGDARQGELSLSSPLGGTLSRLQWRPGSASLRTGSRTDRYESLDALVAQAAGAPLPVAALFDWLHGIDTPAPGWAADLSRLPSGRIAAHRIAPPPQADLRLVLDR